MGESRIIKYGGSFIIFWFVLIVVGGLMNVREGNITIALLISLFITLLISWLLFRKKMGTGNLFEKFEEKQNIKPDKAINIKRDFWAVCFQDGKSLAALGHYDEAHEAYKKAIDINPDFWAVWFQDGKSLAALGRHYEALEAYKKAIDINPDAWAVWFHRGKSLDALSRHDEALEAYNKAKKFKQDHPEALTKEGIALEKLGREKESEVDKRDTKVEKKTDVGVFISYIRENKEEAHRLCKDLQKSGINVWIDKDKIKPGHFWQDVIRDAIKKGSFFIACFSKEFKERIRSHMHEELTLAIEELRKRPKDRAWFIPVLFSGEVPNLTISDGVTIRHIQWVDLSQGWDNGINEILSVVSPNAR